MSEESIYEPDELAAIDAWRPPAPPDGREAAVGAVRRHSAGGALMAAAMLGLRDVLEPPRDDAPVVVEVPGDPHGPSGPVELHFDAESPAATVAVLRRR
ncbi:MAG: hypothetical protein KY450_08455 [Actinobacteria bacterium]|nr:hypothetical protein [Actinomycetota bacterium]